MEHSINQLKQLTRLKEESFNATKHIISMRNMSHGFNKRIYAHLIYKTRVREQRALIKAIKDKSKAA